MDQLWSLLSLALVIMSELLKQSTIILESEDDHKSLYSIECFKSRKDCKTLNSQRSGDSGLIGLCLVLKLTKFI